MSDKAKITFEDCEELCDEVIAETGTTTDEIYLWKRLWKGLVSKLGQSNNPQFDLILKPPSSNEPDSPDTIIAKTRDEIRRLLERHSVDSQRCMEVFDKFRTTRGN